MSVPIVTHVVPQRVLDDSRTFLYSVGLQGCEGTGLWIGVPSGNAVNIVRFFAPEQIATKTAYGVAVDLTRRAHLTLTDNLQDGEQFYVRIHSHPGRAYHSQRDDENPILTHKGALSIVVPNFARQQIILAQCAIYRLEHGRGWMQLDNQDIAQTFKVVP
jgi:hypothetical protein